MQGQPRPSPSYPYQPPPSHVPAPTGFPGYPAPTTGYPPQHFPPSNLPPSGHQAGQGYDFGQGQTPQPAPPTGYPSVSMATVPVMGRAPSQPIPRFPSQPSHTLATPPTHSLAGQPARSSSGPPTYNLAGPPTVGGQAVPALTAGVQQMHMVDSRGQGAPPSGKVLPTCSLVYYRCVCACVRVCMIE